MNRTFHNLPYFLMVIAFLLFSFTILQLMDTIVSREIINRFLFDADSMYLHSLYRDLCINGNSLSDWMLPPAPVFFPDMLLIFLLQFITNSVQISTYSYGFIQITAFIFSCSFLYYAISKNQISFTVAFLQGILVTSIILQLAITLEGFNPYLHLLRSGFHMFSLIHSIAGFALIESLINKYSKKRLTVLILLVFISIFSDRMMFLYFTLPAITALLILFLFYRNNTLIKTVIAIAISTSFAFWLFNWFQKKGIIKILPSNVDPKNILSLDWIEQVIDTIINYPKTFPYFNAVIIISAVFALLAALSILISRHSIHTKTSRSKFSNTDSITPYHNSGLLLSVSLFIITPIILQLTWIIFSNEKISFVIDRYNFPIYFYPLIFFPVLIINIDTKHFSYIGIFITAFLLLVNLSNYKGNIPDPEFKPTTVQCVDRLSEKYPLRFGLGDYWSAKPVSMLSTKGIQVNQVFDSLELRAHINSIHWYSDVPGYDFIITSRLDEKKAVQKAGVPDSVEICDGEKFWIYKNPFMPEVLKPENIELWKYFTGY